MANHLGYKDEGSDSAIQLGRKDASAELGGGGLTNLLPAFLCFIVFGILISFSKPAPTFISILLSVLLALLMGFLLIGILFLIFNSGNAAPQREGNPSFALEATAAGLLLMIPFTALALLAQLALGWNTATAFASAAITTSSASAGTEAMKRGAKGVKNVILPSLLALAVSTGWMLLIGLLP